VPRERFSRDVHEELATTGWVPFPYLRLSSRNELLDDRPPLAFDQCPHDPSTFSGRVQGPGLCLGRELERLFEALLGGFFWYVIEFNAEILFSRNPVALTPRVCAFRAADPITLILGKTAPSP